MNNLILRCPYLKVNKKKGFTLIELVVVIGIMAVLALIMVPNLTAYIQKANNAKIQANLKQVHTSAELVDKTEAELNIDEGAFRDKVDTFANLSDEESHKYHYEKDSNSGRITVSYTDDKGELHTFNGTANSSGPVGSDRPAEGDTGLSLAEQEALKNSYEALFNATVSVLESGNYNNDGEEYNPEVEKANNLRLINDILKDGSLSQYGFKIKTLQAGTEYENHVLESGSFDYVVISQAGKPEDVIFTGVARGDKGSAHWSNKTFTYYPPATSGGGDK